MTSSPALIGFFTGIYVLSIAAYLGVWLQPPGHGNFERYYSNVYLTIMPFAGGIAGLLRLRGASSKPRRSVLIIFSIGLLVWAAGSVAWSLYNVRRIEIPYPSWADAGYFPQIFLWIVGALMMFKMARTNVIEEMKTPAAWVTAICGGIVTVLRWVRGNTFTPDATQDMIKFAFDVAYPVTEIIASALFVALVFGASSRALGTASHGTERAGYAFVVGTLILTAADFIFNFTTSLKPSSALAYYNGNWVDVVYLSAFYALSIGLALLPVNEPPMTWP